MQSITIKYLDNHYRKLYNNSYNYLNYKSLRLLRRFFRLRKINKLKGFRTWNLSSSYMNCANLIQCVHFQNYVRVSNSKALGPGCISSALCISVLRTSLWNVKSLWECTEARQACNVLKITIRLHTDIKSNTRFIKISKYFCIYTTIITEKKLSTHRKLRTFLSTCYAV